MARFRDYYIKREASVSDSDTTILDLDFKDPISFITVELQATNGATSCLDRELHDDVSLIEIVDGSDVLWSLSMRQALALDAYSLNKLPHQLLTEAAAGVQEEQIIIPFGRYLDDLDFYLDPTKFRNPQLRITHALTISATAGFATGTGAITVMARLIEEGSRAQQGFLMAKEKYSWTSATSGDETIDLPRDFPYRLLLPQALLTTYTPQEVLTKHKLSIDGDRYIPINNYTEDIVDANQAQFGMFQQPKTVLTANAGTALLDLYDTRKGFFTIVPALHVAQITGIDAEQLTFGLDVLAATPTIALQTAAQNIGVAIEGLAPFGVLALPFGDLYDPATWLPAPTFGDIKLYSTQAAAGACAIILQQHRR